MLFRSLAKKSKGLQTRRRIEARLNDRKVFAWLADPNVPEDKKLNAFFDLPDTSKIEFNRYGELRKAPRLVQHLFERIAPMFEDRDGGYTRIVKLDKHRLGVGTDLVLVQLVGREDGPQVGGGTSSRRKQADRRTAFAAKLAESFGGGTAVAEEEPPAEAVIAPHTVDCVTLSYERHARLPHPRLTIRTTARPVTAAAVRALIEYSTLVLEREQNAMPLSRTATADLRERFVKCDSEVDSIDAARDGQIFQSM